MSNLVAVYGSLRKGMHNHKVLGCAKHICNAKIQGFGMYSMGSYPAITPVGKHTDVVVEVYEVGSLVNLDRLEGFPNFYDRKLLDIETDCGIIKVWVYFMEVEFDSALIESGDWVEYMLNGG